MTSLNTLTMLFVLLTATLLIVAIVAGVRSWRQLRSTLRQQQSSHEILAAVSRVNTNFLLYKDPRRRFGELLETLKDLTGSPMGFISERMEKDGKPFMRCYAITNLAWDEASKDFYDSNIEQGIDFHRLDNLFGHTLTTGEVTIANHCDQGPRSNRVPAGHPDIQSFIGIPLKFQGEVLGMFALANGKEAYSEAFAEWLEPLTNTITGIMYAFRIERAQREASHRMLAARNEAEHANLIKSDFLATMSHEIRTPLNAVVGMLDSLDNTPLSAQQQEFVHTAESAADTLLSLINDVLDFSKIEAGQLSLQSVPVNLCHQAHTVLSLASATPAAQGIDLYLRVAPDTPLEVNGDPVRLRQLLHNLVGNAVKFTHQGHVCVDITPLRHEEGRVDGVRISVEDTGIGIEQEDLPIIFNAFRQIDHSTTREYQGTGLGLAITQRLVNAMQGRIDVVSHVNQGSRFILELPLAPLGEATLTADLSRLPLAHCRALCVTNSHNLFEYLYNLLSPHLAALDCHFKPLIEDEDAGHYDLLLIDDRRYPIDNDSLRYWVQQQSGQGEVIVLGNRDFAELFIPVSAQVRMPLSPIELVGALTQLYRPELLPASEASTVSTQADTLMGITEGLNILIAEDHPVNQKMMEVLMQRAGADFRICSDGREALHALQSEQDFDLVLMDLHMPNMDGFDATRAIRELPPPLNRTPIIAVTADALAGDREKCLQAGMNDYLAKPVRLSELQQVIGRTLASTFMPTGHSGPAIEARPSVEFDAETLIAELGGAENAVLLIHDFADTLHAELSCVHQALEDGDLERARLAAHRVKGSARTLRCEHLAEQLQTIEHHCRAEQLDQAREAYQQLEASLPALEMRLLQFCAQHMHS